MAATKNKRKHEQPAEATSSTRQNAPLRVAAAAFNAARAASGGALEDGGCGSALGSRAH